MFTLNEKNIKIICTAIGAIILCVALIICGAYLANRDNSEEEASETETTVEVTTEESTTAPEVEIIIPEDENFEELETQTEAQTEYKLTLSDLEIGDTSWAYFIVNRTNYIPQGYEQNLSLEGVWSNGRNYYFDSRIADFAQCMINDAERDGVTLLVCSAYRTHSSQTANFENQVKAYASAKYSFADAYTYTSRYIAIPGTSEHQTGLAVDFITPGYMYLDDGFENTAAYKWLSENSYKYGFILRYPSSKAAETGINYEPWHFRFIGFEYAEDIYNSGLCLEEYMAAEGSVSFNPMAPLVIPAEPAWYQSYINPPEPETEATDSAETDSVETESETEAETETNPEDELPDWLRTESASTDVADSTDFDSTDEGETEQDGDLAEGDDSLEGDESSDSEDVTESEETSESEEVVDSSEDETDSADDTDSIDTTDFSEDITDFEPTDEMTTEDTVTEDEAVVSEEIETEDAMPDEAESSEDETEEEE